MVHLNTLTKPVLITAATQTQGYGTNNRKWTSIEGNLLATFCILEKQCKLNQFFPNTPLSLACAYLIKEAIKQLIRPFINLKHLGMLKDRVSSYYLLGPSGVGKTSSVRFIAEELNIPILTLQGSEYGQEHTARELFGAPPSYVGYDKEGGVLQKFIRSNPESIILFDEIDKVHYSICQSLTNFLGDSFLISHDGEKIPFKGFVYFTSNTGNKASESGGREMGFKDETIPDSEIERRRILSILREQNIGEAFLGRIIDFVTFTSLKPSDLSKILWANIDMVNNDLKHYQIGITDLAQTQIIQMGNPQLWGARNIQNNLDRLVSNCNYEFEMQGNIPEGSIISIDFADGKFVYSLKDQTLFKIEAY